LFKKTIRLYYTVKYLKLKQIFWRIINFLPRFISELNFYPKINCDQQSNNFIQRKSITSDFLHFTFLNETYNLSEIGWDNTNISKLWRYNLHYFDYLLQDKDVSNIQIKCQIDLIENWINNNAFGKGTAWEPYPTSVRIINWIKWHKLCRGLSEKAKLSLWNQTRWLAARPEYHLLGNHLFINAKALFFSAALFQLNNNNKIYKRAISILNKELDEQFLSDGAHFELSPMYHSLAMEDLLDLLSISNNLPVTFPKEKIKIKFLKGMDWLKTMIYNNEELSHFNDCANGIAPKYSELKIYANHLGLDLSIQENNNFYYHSDSGFIVFEDNDSHLVADVAKIGPSYLPGHAHADTLSFELAIFGQRIIVNSGTSVYGISLERIRQRGTAAHSTIEIDGLNSSEVWSGFRVARRAIPFNIQISPHVLQKNNVSFKASHDGYKRLKNKPIHKRTWIFNKNEWFIVDEISGNNNDVISRYYLHPDLHIKDMINGYVVSNKNRTLASITFSNKSNIELIDSTYHDEFGVTRLNKCIVLKSTSPCKITVKIEIL
jgi:uncharacterized heparinase superfamily protein